MCDRFELSAFRGGAATCIICGWEYCLGFIVNLTVFPTVRELLKIGEDLTKLLCIGGPLFGMEIYFFLSYVWWSGIRTVLANGCVLCNGSVA